MQDAFIKSWKFSLYQVILHKKMPPSQFHYTGYYGRHEGHVKTFEAKSLRALAQQMQIAYTTALRAVRKDGEPLAYLPIRIEKKPLPFH